MKNGPWGRIPDLPWGLHGRLPAPAPHCPNCDKQLNGYTSVEFDGAEMKPGATTLCVECGAFLRYLGEPLGFMRLEGEELALVRAHPMGRRMEQAWRRGEVPNRQQRRAAARRA